MEDYTFKNPKDQTDKKAWEIIEDAGLKNFEFQGICFSSKHSNFIVNNQTNSANNPTLNEKKKDRPRNGNLERLKERSILTLKFDQISVSRLIAVNGIR